LLLFRKKAVIISVGILWFIWNKEAITIFLEVSKTQTLKKVSLYIYIYIYIYIHIYIIWNLYSFSSSSPRKFPFPYEDIVIVYKRINCSLYSWLSNSQATPTTLTPVSLTEQNVRMGDKTYVSSHTWRAQVTNIAVWFCIPSCYSFVVNTLLQTVWFRHLLDRRNWTVGELLPM